MVEEIAKALAFETSDFGEVRVTGDTRLFSAIQRRFEQAGQLRQAIDAAASIRKNMALAPSIDNFLDARKDDEVLVEVGKLAIANQLLHSERASSLTFDESNIYNRIEFSRLNENWLKALFRLLVERRDYQAFLAALERIKFVCFNYDRVIERFFFLATESYFEISQNRVADDLGNHLSIVHPYGALGQLRFQVIGSGFGAGASASDLMGIATGIRTFTEGVSDPLLTPRVQGFIQSSEVICFLGFAFHPMNVGLLGVQNIFLSRIIGTSRGLSQVTKDIVSRELQDVLGTSLEPEFFSVDASELISHYSAFLSGR